MRDQLNRDLATSAVSASGWDPDRFWKENVAKATKLVGRLDRFRSQPPHHGNASAALVPEVQMRVQTAFMKDGQLSHEGVETLRNIDRYGFVSIHQSLRTGGGMDSVKARRMTELNMIGNHSDTIPASLFPKYGYLNIKGYPLNLSEGESLVQYGPIIFRFKPEVNQRATYSVGDSLFRKEPVPKLGSLTAEAIRHEKTPPFYEAEIWGPLSLGDVKEVYIDASYATTDMDTLNELKDLADRYGFPIYATRMKICFNQSGNLFRRLIYSPDASQAQAGFRLPDEAQMLERLQSTHNDVERTLILDFLGESGARKYASVFRRYLMDPSENVQLSAAIQLLRTGGADSGELEKAMPWLHHERAFQAALDDKIFHSSDLRSGHYLMENVSSSELASDLMEQHFDPMRESDRTVLISWLNGPLVMRLNFANSLSKLRDAENYGEFILALARDKESIVAASILNQRDRFPKGIREALEPIYQSRKSEIQVYSETKTVEKVETLEKAPLAEIVDQFNRTMTVQALPPGFFDVARSVAFRIRRGIPESDLRKMISIALERDRFKATFYAKQFIIQVLGIAKTPQAEATLSEIMRSGDESVRWGAISALQTFDSPSSHATLKSYFLSSATPLDEKVAMLESLINAGRADHEILAHARTLKDPGIEALLKREPH